MSINFLNWDPTCNRLDGVWMDEFTYWAKEQDGYALVLTDDRPGVEPTYTIAREDEDGRYILRYDQSYGADRLTPIYGERFDYSRCAYVDEQLLDDEELEGETRYRDCSENRLELDALMDRFKPVWAKLQADYTAQVTAFLAETRAELEKSGDWWDGAEVRLEAEAYMVDTVERILDGSLTPAEFADEFR